MLVGYLWTSSLNRVVPSTWNYWVYVEVWSLLWFILHTAVYTTHLKFHEIKHIFSLWSSHAKYNYISVHVNTYITLSSRNYCTKHNWNTQLHKLSVLYSQSAVFLCGGRRQEKESGELQGCVRLHILCTELADFGDHWLVTD